MSNYPNPNDPAQQGYPAQPVYAAQPAQAAASPGAKQPLSIIEGKRAIAKFGTLTPSMFGATTLELHADRVVERSKGIVYARTCHLLATDIESAEVVAAGNPILLTLGILTLPLFGLGLLFIILYFFQKHKFLLIASGGNVAVMAIKGDEGMSHVFVDNVTKVALHCKRTS